MPQLAKIRRFTRLNIVSYLKRVVQNLPWETLAAAFFAYRMSHVITVRHLLKITTEVFFECFFTDLKKIVDRYINWRFYEK